MATTTAIREIIEIDEDLCDGCGLCIPACAEGALAIVDGKARLVADVYCDGMGSCLGECPQDAIRIVKREAAEYDEAAVEERLASIRPPVAEQQPSSPPEQHCGCPGSASRSFAPAAQPAKASADGVKLRSQLRNWPVELKLVPVQAPYYQGAKLLISADCVPFAYADFHGDLLKDRVLLIGCPKLDDPEFYIEKLAQIFSQNEIASIDVAFMEVPCCMGLIHIVKSALGASGKAIPGQVIRIGIQGERQSTTPFEDLPF